MKIQLVTDRNRVIDQEIGQPVSALGVGERVVTVRNPTSEPLGADAARWIIEHVQPLM